MIRVIDTIPSEGFILRGMVVSLEKEIITLRKSLQKERKEKMAFEVENDLLRQKILSLSIDYDSLLQKLALYFHAKSTREEKQRQNFLKLAPPIETNSKGGGSSSYVRPDPICRARSTYETTPTEKNEGCNVPIDAMPCCSQETQVSNYLRSTQLMEERMQKIISSVRCKRSRIHQSMEDDEKLNYDKSCSFLIPSKKIQRRRQTHPKIDRNNTSNRNRNEILQKWRDREAARTKAILELSKNLSSLTSFADDVSEAHILGNGMLKDRYSDSDEEDSHVAKLITANSRLSTF